jgi:hypothetical protein
VGSAAVGHLAILATLPVIGRVYLRADMGRLAAFLAFLGILVEWQAIM